MSNKKEKQEVKDVGFSFSNIENVNEIINSDFKKNDSFLFKFRIHRSYFNKFHTLKNNRAIKINKYDDLNQDVFAIMIKVVKEYLLKKNIYIDIINSPTKDSKIFLANINKRGKRAKNKRSVDKEFACKLQLTLNEEYNNVFLNCFYSFIVNESMEDVLDPVLSKNYFFNDIIDIVFKNESVFNKTS